MWRNLEFHTHAASDKLNSGTHQELLDCDCNFPSLSPNYPTDQPRPAHLLVGWLPVARLPVLPPQTASEGKGGQRQAGGRTGDAGAHRHRVQRLQTSQQRRRCCGSLELHDGDVDSGNCRNYFCTCLQSEHQQFTHPHIYNLFWYFQCFVFGHCCCTFCSPQTTISTEQIGSLMLCHDSELDLQFLVIWEEMCHHHLLLFIYFGLVSKSQISVI